MAVNYISIGERIRVVRKRRGLSQNVLAEKIKRSPSYVSYVEGGVRGMSLDTFLDIANVLNATADELLADNLVNTVKVSNHEFAALLSDCSEYEKKVLFDVVTATKASLRCNSTYVFYHQE